MADRNLSVKDFKDYFSKTVLASYSCNTYSKRLDMIVYPETSLLRFEVYLNGNFRGYSDDLEATLELYNSLKG